MRISAESVLAGGEAGGWRQVGPRDAGGPHCHVVPCVCVCVPGCARGDPLGCEERLSEFLLVFTFLNSHLFECVFYVF